MKLVKIGLWYIRNQGREWLKRLIARLADSFGYEFLSKAQTVAYLTPYLNALYPEAHVLLPEVYAVANPNQLFFSETEIGTAASRVWRYHTSNGQGIVLRCGLLMVGKKS
jgi:hypothetical protein